MHIPLKPIRRFATLSTLIGMPEKRLQILFETSGPDCYDWNSGMMECWNDGFKGILSNQNGFYIRFTHFSNIPLFRMIGITEATKII
jgi:hypothetical protein